MTTRNSPSTLLCALVQSQRQAIEAAATARQSGASLSHAVRAGQTSAAGALSRAQSRCGRGAQRDDGIAGERLPESLLWKLCPWPMRFLQGAAPRQRLQRPPPPSTLATTQQCRKAQTCAVGHLSSSGALRTRTRSARRRPLRVEHNKQRRTPVPREGRAATYLEGFQEAVRKRSLPLRALRLLRLAPALRPLYPSSRSGPGPNRLHRRRLRRLRCRHSLSENKRPGVSAASEPCQTCNRVRPANTSG